VFRCYQNYQDSHFGSTRVEKTCPYLKSCRIDVICFQIIMCMSFIFISDDPESKYKLIILNNRDESVDRPTLELDWRNGVLSGTDIKDPVKGTWFGTNTIGSVGILLSITEPLTAKKFHHGPSRGAIAKEFLESARPCEEFFSELCEKAHLYNGFQFLGLQRNEHNCYEMTSLSNMLVDSVEPRKWPAGTYVWGNSPPDKPFRKVVEGQKVFEKFIASLDPETDVDHLISRLMEIATDETEYSPDPQIAVQTEKPLEWYRHYCSVMVKFPLDMFRFGTRSHSILIVDREDHATFYENRMASPPQNGQPAQWLDKTITFKLDPIGIQSQTR
ncbi:Ser/Thr-rich protein T10 in DGCR region, partial [Trichostrongylus colubriformis]